MKIQLFNYKTIFLLLAFTISFTVVSSNNNKYPIIPVPAKLKTEKGQFIFDQYTKIYIESGNTEDVNKAFCLFRKQFAYLSDISLPITSDNLTKNVIRCAINNKLENNESYILDIKQEHIRIEAKSSVGIFYALQSIRQLLPAEFESRNKVNAIKWTVNACRIEDAPEFVYRGFHLDVCRHFVPVEEVKNYIDQMALLKLNIFHWHLTEDQAWRIEIKKYPKLTSVGSKRYRTVVGHTNDYPRQWDNSITQDFYTQEEIKEVVAYAQQRFVTIIPEIEMPGHATAALAAYPELSCSGGPFDVEGRWGVFNDIFCTKDETFEFLENVLTEVAELFPSSYIHIGGDEAPKVRWQRCHICQERMKNEGLKDEHELQSYFVKRMEKVVHRLGKRIIGWDEILEGGIAPDATVMSWRGVAGGISAAKQGHDVIMTPSEAMYFDFYQSQLQDDSLTIGGYLPIERVYAFNPITKELSKEERKHILGVQANTWTEYMPNRIVREAMIFPRMATLAEVGWSAENNKSFDSFAERLPSLLARYDEMELGYSEAFYSIKAVPLTIDNQLMLKLKTAAPNTVIYYTLDGSDPDQSSKIYSQPIAIGGREFTLKAIATKDGKMMYRPYVRDFIINKAAGQKLIFEDINGNSFTQDGSGNLTDCMIGGEPVSRPDWFSYAGADGSITIEFGAPQTISNIIFSSANQNNVLVYSPKEIGFLVSEDGNNFRSVGLVTHEQIADSDGKASVNFTPAIAKKIKLNIKMYGIIPDSEPNSGQMSALFADEIIVQ